MRKRQHEVLGERIHEGEGHLVVVPFAINGVKAHILQHIVHPAHVPLVVKAHAAHVDRPGNQWPRSGFLGNHQRLRMELENRFIELLEEIHGLEISGIAVFVGHPLAILAAIVEIEHIGHRVDAQAVNMEFLKPEHGVGYQEALHLRAAVVKVRGSPLPVLGPLHVVGLVEVLAIEVAQPLFVLAEVTRHPVHDDADAHLMGTVHEITEVIRRTVAAGHGIVARGLIAPGTIKGMLTEGHEFDMGVIHVLHIGDKLVGSLPIGEVFPLRCAPPGPHVHLIGQHGTVIGRFLVLLYLPGIVVPLIMVHVKSAGCRLRLLFRIEAIRVSLQNMGAAPLGFNGVLIEFALPQFFHEGRPDFPITDFMHGRHPGIPVIEVAHHAYRFGMGCPDGKADSLFALLFDKMCPQHFIGVIIRSLMKQVTVKLAQIRCFQSNPPWLFTKCGPVLHARFHLRIRQWYGQRRTDRSWRCSWPRISASPAYPCSGA